MFYNLAKYIKNVFPAETIYTNVISKRSVQDNVPDRIVLLRETGGGETPDFKFVRKTFQVITRDFDAPDARKLSWDIYEEITSRFGLVLPSVTVDTILYPEIQSAQITAINEPQSLGADDDGRMEFVTNYIVIYERT